ncbi:MerR family DNA-binding transcriptional regulator [Kibdelosporangium aridum]|uniref:MerR family DNA-binding transcriptional regulator n=1 Tax=Kibdelosporangium aridum TaxID=2030 RepID=A0A428Y364_KIBAR|nr:MerR family transcriptional regulator [Kibdelosporangium aridum]RSM62006.1 MerR family DNA-binding transcriptional regulator [Kibdelosporangium aridum]
MRHGVTIGQAATFVGVTVKTVRHYHKLGLVEEPERDSSGYRRYGSAELLRLVQVRTLATAGVPLAEIGPLLDADAEQFAAALAAAERRLTDRIADLIAQRDTLHRLTGGDRVLLPDRACAILDRMSALGFNPDYVAAQREALVLTRALVPEGFDNFLAQLEHRLDDPGYIDLTKRASEAETWEPDDPRIEELATAMADHYLANPTLLGTPRGMHAWTNASTQYRLINNHREDQAPISARLTALTEMKLRSAGVPIPRQ